MIDAADHSDLGVDPDQDRFDAQFAAQFDAVDDSYMARALALAARGLFTTDPNPRVGCVLVRERCVIGEGWHERAGEPHAEVMALRSVGGAARGATAYVTLEPCSHTGRTAPCADALIAAGVARVVCAVADPNPKVAGSGLARLAAAGVAIAVGLRAGQARTLNAGFFSRFERGRPLVRLKLAMSLDARTAPVGGGQRWLTGEAARADVQSWRARSTAVLTGAGTVRSDDPRLDVRLAYGPWIRQPLRVVLDTELTCAPAARIFDGGGALVFAADDAGGAGAGAGGIAIERVPRSARGLDLRAVLKRLTALQVNELFVECGARVAAGFLEAGLVDELILYVAPILLGANAVPLTALNGLAAGAASGSASLASALPEFEFREQRLIGGDLRLLLTPKRA